MENPFWCYSLNIYKKQGVQEECLQFQNEFGGNVNILLFCCWLGQQGFLLNQNQLAELTELAQFWDNAVLLALREIRIQADKLGEQRFYSGIKKAELHAEMIFQNALICWFQGDQWATTCEHTARKNIELYCGRLWNFPKLLKAIDSSPQKIA